jgi:hypothetical protein
VPTIDLVVGSDKSNTSPILKLFLSAGRSDRTGVEKLDELSD